MEKTPWGRRYSYPAEGWVENEPRKVGEEIFVTHDVPLSRGEVEALAFAQKWVGFGNPANYVAYGGKLQLMRKSGVSLYVHKYLAARAAFGAKTV